MINGFAAVDDGAALQRDVAHVPDHFWIAFHALDTITYLEQLLSVYIPTSELSLINQQATANSVRVSESTFAMLQLGLAVFAKTGGTFDMTSAKLSKTWGFYRRQGRMPTEQQIEEALAEVGSEKPFSTSASAKRSIHFFRNVAF